MKVFPQINNSYEDHRTGCEIYQYDEGMDLRDYFAAKAMQSLLLSTQQAYHDQKIMDYNFKNEASLAYEMADAMIKQRNK